MAALMNVTNSLRKQFFLDQRACVLLAEYKEDNKVFAASLFRSLHRLLFYVLVLSTTYLTIHARKQIQVRHVKHCAIDQLLLHFFLVLKTAQLAETNHHWLNQSLLFWWYCFAEQMQQVLSHFYKI